MERAEVFFDHLSRDPHNAEYRLHAEFWAHEAWKSGEVKLGGYHDFRLRIDELLAGPADIPDIRPLPAQPPRRQAA